MEIEILFLGKTKQDALQQCIDDYLKRLGHYARVNIKLIKTGKVKGTDEMIIGRESDLLKKNINGSARIVALDRTGQQYSSEEFAALFDSFELCGTPKVIFVIGGPLGLSSTILKMAHKKLSLSKMTFTHDMSRLLLMEQIYRAYTIKANEKYHK